MSTIKEMSSHVVQVQTLVCVLILCPIESVDSSVPVCMKILKKLRWFRPRRAIGFDHASGAIESNCPSGSKSSRIFQNYHADRDGTVHALDGTEYRSFKKNKRMTPPIVRVFIVKPADFIVAFCQTIMRVNPKLLEGGGSGGDGSGEGSELENQCKQYFKSKNISQLGKCAWSFNFNYEQHLNPSKWRTVASLSTWKILKNRDVFGRGFDRAFDVIDPTACQSRKHLQFFKSWCWTVRVILMSSSIDVITINYVMYSGNLASVFNVERISSGYRQIPWWFCWRSNDDRRKSAGYGRYDAVGNVENEHWGKLNEDFGVIWTKLCLTFRPWSSIFVRWNRS